MKGGNPVLALATKMLKVGDDDDEKKERKLLYNMGLSIEGNT
jgi:hypothetical protein